MDRWKRLRCWLSVLSPCSPSSSPCDDNESYPVGRRLHGRPLGVSGRPRPCLHCSCGSGSIRSRGGGNRSPDLISRHYSYNLRRNRILRSSSGSRGPGPPNLNLSASLLFALLPSPSEQRERRDAGQRYGGGGGGVPIIAPVGAPGGISFRPPRRGDPPFVLHCRFYGLRLPSPRVPWSTAPPFLGDGWPLSPKGAPFFAGMRRPLPPDCGLVSRSSCSLVCRPVRSSSRRFAQRRCRRHRRGWQRRRYYKWAGLAP